MKETGNGKDGDRRHSPLPLWLDIEASIQARASVLERASEVTHPNLHAAFADARALTVQGPTASGKTELMVEQGVKNLNAATTRQLVILAVPTRASRGMLKKRMRRYRGLARGAMQGLVSLISGRPSPALRDKKTGEIRYRVILATHATLMQRGDDPSDEGRLIRMLENLAETESRLELEPLEVLLIIDEGEAFVSALTQAYKTGYRMITATDPKTGEMVEGVAKLCIKRCDRCRDVMNGTQARTQKQGVKHEVFRIKPEPKNGNAMAVSTQSLLDALSDERVLTRGVEFARYDLQRLPQDVGLLRSLPSNDEGAGDDHAQLKMGPNPAGILIEAARSPFAYAVRTLPRDRDGNLVRPEDTADLEGVIWPKRPCEVWTTMSWNARPLVRLRDLLAMTGRVLLLSATWSQTPLTLVHSVFPNRSHVVAPSGEARKMNGVLFITVPGLPVTKEQITSFSKVANTFVVLARSEDIEGFAEELMEWDGDEELEEYPEEGQEDDREDSGAPTINPGYWSKGVRDRDVTDKLPNPFFSYARAATGRSLNMGHYRIMLIKNNLHASLMDTLGACNDFNDLPLIVETDRRTLQIQNMGRLMRKDEKAPDPLLRVFVYEGLEDKETGQWIDDGGYAVERLKGQVVNGNVQHLILQVNPKLAVEAARQFLAGEPVTVTDAVKRNAANMSIRERRVTAEIRAKKREEQDEARAAARETVRVVKRRGLEVLCQSGLPWWKARNKLNLGKYFPADEIETMKEQYVTSLSSKSLA